MKQLGQKTGEFFFYSMKWDYENHYSLKYLPPKKFRYLIRILKIGMVDSSQMPSEITY